MTDEKSGWDVSPQRRRQLARLDAIRRVSATDELIEGLRRDLMGLAVPVDVAETLVAGAKALLPVAQRGGFDLALTVGAEPGWTVRVHPDHLVAEAQPDPEAPAASPRPDVAAQLAQMLRREGGTQR